MRWLVCAVVLAACGDREHAAQQVDQPSALEAAIARDLTARFGAAPVVHCASIFGYPRGCSATLDERCAGAARSTPEGECGSIERFGIRVRDVGRTWRWQVLGLVVTTAPIEAYVRGVLDDLGAAQGVACGARVRHVAPNDRIACDLARGGKAFVTIAADGTMALELALDPAAARARSESVPGLEHRSRALAHTDESDDDEVGVTTDAGVESAP